MGIKKAPIGAFFYIGYVLDSVNWRRKTIALGCDYGDYGSGMRSRLRVDMVPVRI